MGVLGWAVAAVVLVLWTVAVVAVTAAELRRRAIRTREIARRVAIVGTVRASSPPILPAGSITVRPLPARYTRRSTPYLPLVS